MKRIGEITARLVHNPIELVAAANEAPRKFGRQAAEEGDSSLPDATVMGATKVAARSDREEQNGPPIASTAEGTGGEAVNGKSARHHRRASTNEGGVKPGKASGSAYRVPMQPVLRLVVSNRERRAVFPAAIEDVSPRPAARLSLVL